MTQGGRRVGAGRPAGSRNKAPPELREIARAHSDKAFARVLQLIDSKDERVALMASNTVLDRAGVRQKQGVTLRSEHLPSARVISERTQQR